MLTYYALQFPDGGYVGETLSGETVAGEQSIDPTHELPRLWGDEDSCKRTQGYIERSRADLALKVVPVEIEWIADEPAEASEPPPEAEPEQADTSAALWLTNVSLDRLTEIEDGATVDKPEGGLFNMELVPDRAVNLIEFETGAGNRQERVAPFHAFGSNAAEPAEGEREVVAHIHYSDGVKTTLRRTFRF